MSSPSAHTIIIGAGPAGLACATALARVGREVLVLERLPATGPKTCAGGIPSAALDPDLPPELLERSFNQQRIITASQNFHLRAARPIICTVNRQRLGSWMQRQAEAAGAMVLGGVRARQIQAQIVLTDQGDFRYRYLVGADGSNSLVRRHLGLPLELAGVGINYQIRGHFEEMEWHLDPHRFGSGYAWIFPHRESASVGVYAFNRGRGSGGLHDRFRRWAEERGLSLDGSKPRASLISFDYRGARFGNILLAGDAAGLASGLTGEGIAAAIFSGRAAAAAIVAEDGRSPDLGTLLPSHARHRALACFTARRPFGGRLLLEALTLALRWRLLSPAALEISRPNR